MPLATYKPKKWRLAEKADPLDYQEQNPAIDTAGDQERARIAADLKQAMRGNTKQEERTFALTAEVGEAHRQSTVHVLLNVAVFVVQ